MSDFITSASQIPDAPYYVCANDKFMSGWGQARGKVNTLIFPCADLMEVDRMVRILDNRPEMKYVRVCYTKPRLKAFGRAYQVKDGSTWR